MRSGEFNQHTLSSIGGMTLIKRDELFLIPHTSNKQLVLLMNISALCSLSLGTVKLFITVSSLSMNWVINCTAFDLRTYSFYFSPDKWDLCNDDILLIYDA